MRYVITSTQIHYLRKEGHLTLENFLKEEEADLLKTLLEMAKLPHPSGRDLERENPPLKKAIPFSHLGQVASQLFGQKRIKCAFTQYSFDYAKEGSLEEVSSVTEILGGVLLSLSTDPAPPLPFLPANVGDAAFFNKNFSLPFPEMKTSFLLIAFAKEMGRYRPCSLDPHTHDLKKLGYGFGDLLLNETHPLISK